MSENSTPSTLLGSLPPGTQLHEYRIERVLGHGGFGITYLARDVNLDKRVAIKEFLPNDIAARGPDQTVSIRSPDSKEAFQWGLESFIKEARVLGKFTHPSLIPVHRFFEGNNTAYFVMEFAEGVTLGTVLKHEGIMGEERLRGILGPILNGLEEVHSRNVLHRDINLDKRVAIKEFLPNDIAARQPDQTVTVRSKDSTEAFKWGLDSFIKEARVLGKFSHSSLIPVHRFFEGNNTAYFVMEFE